MNIPSSSKFKIAPTASLVLSLASEVYKDGNISQAYFENIDHPDTALFEQPILESYQHINAVAVIRKRFIRHLFARYADLFPVFQVCILGAGLDPLSLYLLERYDEKISNIFEVDKTFMDEKRGMYKKLIGDNDKLKLMTYDVTDTASLLEELKKSGHHQSHPTIFVMEGLIYYISRDKLGTMLEKLKTSDKRNHFILEYGLPFEDVPENDRDGCRNLIRSMEQNTGWPMQTYHRSDIMGLLHFFGCDINTVDSVRSMEDQLAIKNKIFNQDGEGLIEITSFAL